MLFNSPVYIFLFLPLVLAGYFLLLRYRLVLAAKTWLVFASLFFYAYWNPVYLPLIVGSMLVNYGIGTVLGRPEPTGRRTLSKKAVLLGAVGLNLALLGYYKYADFFLVNLNAMAGSEFSLLHLALPLAISFFTFQQIAYLVDSYQGQTQEYDFLNYCLFVTFFPQLIAGPIVHHKEMMPQFERVRGKVLNYRNLATGLFIFALGLFKKVVVADTFAVWASLGFDQLSELSFLGAWTASLSYALQLYFDFSGYTDMAIGSALMFNIVLPLNFNSPYKALNIQDFWRRWHMTLSRWLRDYLYIPLGGNRRGPRRTYVNLFLTFLLGGLWHGAGWTFVAWGALHGAGTAAHKWWQDRGLRLPRWLAWLLTFNFVNFAWVFFRAKSFDDALKVLEGMFGLNGFALPEAFDDYSLSLALVFLAVAVLGRNSLELAKNFAPTWRYAAVTAVLAVWSILSLSRVSEFLYFQF
ncbi:peptidoglycan O-acetyltransferase [Desulfuromonas versatilis]|uniref:Peptidoglycan O-acetyltransferase n=1 Tax=Desulfuromonas versatilis TaxID=2802975 RepID=A0ABN6DZC5_9BACT|nr:MBOAT family protein [Desulfuromonas versatilis]BCR04549.1 peptidoglycan O-acetyltransferase [Desulfuromonas versatilis]